MCARRFLMVILVLTLLVVAGAFAIFQFGDRVLIDKAKPKGHFVAAAAGGGPDYKSAANWVSRPGLTDDPASWLPDGVKQGAVGNAAVFYIHPTTYLVHRPLERAAATRRRLRVPHAPVHAEPGERIQRRGADLGAALPAGGVRRLPAQQRGCEEGARPGLWRRPRCLRPVRKRGRRSADHSRCAQPGLAPPRAAASRADRRQADRQAGGRRLRRRLADQHAPPTCPPSASPLVRPRTRAAASCRG